MSGLSNLEVVSLKSLENLQQFEAFFDMVRNPDKYAKIVADAKDTIAKAKSVVEAYTTVDLANEYLLKAKVYASEKTAEIEAKQKEVMDKFNANEAEHKAKLKELADLKDTVNKQIAELQSTRAKYEEDVKILNDNRAKVAIRAKELGDKEKELLSKEEELLEKANKLKSIMGI